MAISSRPDNTLGQLLEGYPHPCPRVLWAVRALERVDMPTPLANYPLVGPGGLHLADEKVVGLLVVDLGQEAAAKLPFFLLSDASAYFLTPSGNSNGMPGGGAKLAGIGPVSAS